MHELEKELLKFDADSEESIFFKKLFEKLDKNLMRKSVKKEVYESKTALNHAIQKYFQAEILMNALISSIENQDSKEIFDVHPLYLNMLKSYIPTNDVTADLKPLGLSQNDLIKVLEGNALSKSQSSKIVNQVENNLNEFCSKVFEYATCYNSALLSNANWKKSFVDALKTLEYHAEQQSTFEKSEPSEKLLKEMHQTYCIEISESLNLLNKMLSLFEKKLQLESSISQFYSLRCEALHLKISIFEMEILEATYNAETIPALKKISNQLDAKKKFLDGELAEKNVSIEAYESLGEKYAALVDEYTHLTKCIHNQKWAIDELKKRTADNFK